MPDFSGWTLKNGQYRLLEKLGAGAYGKVYRALDTTATSEKTRYYAIKCLLKHPSGSDKERLQQREISIHRHVSGHPNIVTFYECFHDHHYVFVVMGLYSGGDLFSAITEKRVYDNQPQKIKAIFIQILNAMQHCHDMGVFHRDVKPENIMLSEDGTTIYLGDFGLSTSRPHSKDYGCGSAFYMSPECIGPPATGEDKGYSNRHNDIWALGVVLINLITGRNPWRLATHDDACFTAFSKNRNFLKEVLPISRQINYLLQQVFRFPAVTRISIPELRQYIVALDTFYEVQDKTATEGDKRGAVTAPCSPNGSDDTSYSSLDSEQYHYGDGISLDIEPSPTMHDGEPVFRSHPKDDFLTPPAPPTRSSAPPSGSIGSGTDSDGSKGPITPASNAAEPNVEVPDVSQQMGGVDASFISKDLAETQGKVGQESKGAHLLKSAYQRLKGL
ncbi:hypothetical protein H1R20_g6908, partial [Candolleomyces eurysporus]